MIPFLPVSKFGPSNIPPKGEASQIGCKVPRFGAQCETVATRSTNWNDGDGANVSRLIGGCFRTTQGKSENKTLMQEGITADENCA